MDEASTGSRAEGERAAADGATGDAHPLPLEPGPRLESPRPPGEGGGLPDTRRATPDDRDARDGETGDRPVRIRDFGAAGPLAIIAMSVPLLGSIVLFWIVARTDAGAWLREQDGMGVALYALAFAVLSGFALMPTYAASAVAGFAFGAVTGSIGAIAGYVGGAVIGYEVARRAARRDVSDVIESRPTWRAVRDALVSDRGLAKTTGIIALVRLPPNSPFALTNLVLSSVSAPRIAFVIGTLVGMAPRTVLAVFIGAGLDQLTKESLKQAAPTWMLWVGIGVLLVVVLVIGQVATRAVHRVTGVAPRDGRAGGA